MKIECPRCRERYDVSDHLGGRNIVCGFCDRHLVAPYPVAGKPDKVQIASELPILLVQWDFHHKFWLIASLCTFGFALPLYAIALVVVRLHNVKVMDRQRL